MEINSLKEVTITKKVLRQIKCDRCGKLLHDVKYQDSSSHYRNEKRYYHVVTHHYDWGANSVDSWEYRDYCFDCLGKALNVYYTDEEPDSGTAAFEVVAKYGYTPKIEEA